MSTRENATRKIRLSAGGLAAIAAMIGANPGFAGGGNDIDWVGADNGLWNVPANWNPMTVPNGAFDVFIENGTTVFSNIPVTIETLTIGLNSGVDQSNSTVFTINGGLLDNDGLFIINSAGNFDAGLIFDGINTITGNGEIFVNGDSLNDRISTTANSTLTHGANHTIRGAGQIRADLINNGTVVADIGGTNNYALLDLVTRDKVNNGLFTTANGAVLDISGIDVDNTNGMILAADGDIHLSSSATIVGGDLESLGASKIFVFAGTITLMDSTLTNNSLLSVSNSTNMLLNGSSFTNQGMVVLNEQGNFDTALQIDGLIDLTGNGEIFINGDTINDRIETTAGSVLTQASGHTISGAGTLRANFINNGVVMSDFAGAGGSYGLLDLTTNNKVNNNLFTTSNGAVLDMSNITVDNTNGIIRAADGDVHISYSATIVGGDLESLGASKIFVFAGTNTLMNSTLTNNSLISVSNSTDLLLSGSSFTNQGMVVLNEQGNFDTALRIDGLIDVTGNGEIFINGDGINDRIETTAGSLLTQASGHTISGAGTLRANFINNGVVMSDFAGAGGSYGLLDLTTNDKVNNNLFTTSNGAVLDMSTITVDNTNGIIRAADGDVHISSNTTVVGGTLESLGASSIFVTLGTNRLTNTTLTSGSTLGVDNSTILLLGGGSLVNDGMITLNTPGNFDTALGVEGNATISGFGELFVNGDSITDRIDIAAGNTLTNGPDHTIRFRIGDIRGELENLGTLIVDDSLRIIDAPNNSELDLPGGTLGGNGTITATAVNNTSGVVAPGNSAGTLTINGDYNQANGSALQIEIGGTDSGVDSDLLVVTGEASLGGALVLQSTNGFIPEPGDSITILTADSISGEFVQILPAQEFCNLGFTVTYTATTVEVEVFDAVSTDEFSFSTGTLLSGSVNDLINADDSRVRGRSVFGFLSSEPNVLELRAGFTTVASPNELTVIFEGRVNNPNATVRVRMRNWNTNSFNQVDAFAIAPANVDVRRLTTGIPATNFIRSSDGKMEVAVRQVVIATFSLSGFISSTDQLQVCGSG